MGTRGLYVFVYNGKHYVFYNNQDSYPEGLGYILITMIKTENYKEWGNILHDKIDNKNYKIRKITYNEYKNKEIVELNKEEIQELNMNDDEWELSLFNSKDSIRYLKWDFYDLIKYNDALKILINKICPTIETSVYSQTFKNLQDENILNDYNVSWTYIIDIDNNKFKIRDNKKEIITFNLENVPYDWMSNIFGLN